MAVHLDFEIGRGLTALVGGDGPQRREVLDGLAGKLARGDARMVSFVFLMPIATLTILLQVFLGYVMVLQ